MNQSEIDRIVRVQMINNIASQLEAEFHEFRESGVRTKSWTKQRPQGGSRYIVHIRKESPRPAII